MKNKFKKHYAALTGLNLLAIPITAYLTYLHYAEDASAVCNISDKLNCDIVNKSIYAEIFGIPVAVLGLAFYVFMLLFSIRGLFRDQSKWIPYVSFFVLCGTGFTLYLTYVEAFILETYCIFCLAQQLIILIELAVFANLYPLNKSS